MLVSVSCGSATGRLIGLIATGNYPNLKLARFDGKDCFCRQLYVLLACGSGLSLQFIPLFRRKPSDGASVGQVIHLLRTSPVLLRTLSAVTGMRVVPCLVDGASGKELSCSVSCDGSSRVESSEDR